MHQGRGRRKRFGWNPRRRGRSPDSIQPSRHTNPRASSHRPSLQRPARAAKPLSSPVDPPTAPLPDLGEFDPDPVRVLDVCIAAPGLLHLQDHGMACFFFNATATTEIYTLSLHDALPIYARGP